MDRVVLQYLKLKGYTSASARLEEDIRARRPGSVSTPTSYGKSTLAESVSAGSKGLFRNSTTGEGVISPSKDVNGGRGKEGSILSWGLLETCPGSVEQSYALLSDFVSGSLESYKTELYSILFPVFAEAYCSLIARGADKEAKRMMENWSAEHQEHYASEVESLRMIVLPEQVEVAEIAQRLKQNRFVVHLCTISYNLLNRFLANTGLLPVIDILNRTVRCTVKDRPPRKEFLVVQLEDNTQPIVDKNGLTNVALQWGAAPQKQVAEYTALLRRKHRRPKDGPKADEEKDERMMPPASTAHINGDGGGSSNTGPSISLETLEAAFPPSQKPPFPEDSELQFSIRQKLALRQLSDMTGESSALECTERELSGTNPDAFVADPLNPSTLLATLLNTHGEVTCTDITSDGFRVAGGFRNCGIRVWTCNHRKGPDMALGEEASNKGPLRLIGHTHPVYSLSWAPGGRFLLSGGGNGTVRLWDVHQKRAQNVVVYRGHCKPVWTVAFGPQGYYFSTGADDHTARLWSTDAIHPLRILVGHLGYVSATAFHPNGTYIITGSSDKTARLWDVRSGNCVRLFTGHTLGLSSVTVRFLLPFAAAALLRTTTPFLIRGSIPLNCYQPIIIVNPERAWSIGCISCLTLPPPPNLVFGCANQLSSDGRTAAAGCEDGEVRTWDIGSSSQIDLFRGHHRPVHSITFSAEGSALATGGGDNTVRVWPIAARQSTPLRSTPICKEVTSTNEGPSTPVASTKSSSNPPTYIFTTKSTPVYTVRYTQQNLLLAVGAFMSPH
eukprot:284118_1